MNKKTKGFTLIETIIFIVIISIVASAILVAFTTTLSSAPLTHQQTTATKTATRCLEWFRGQRNIFGFSGTATTCTSTTPAIITTPSFCSAPTNYSITTKCSISADSNFKTITVSVSGPGNATLSLLLAKY